MPRATPRLKRPAAPDRSVFAVREEIEKTSVHTLEWQANNLAVCAVCEIRLLLIPRRLAAWEGGQVGPQKYRAGGWSHKQVWGGNDEGIGGLLKEPHCIGEK